MDDEKPPSKIQDNKGISFKYRDIDRDFRTLCGLFARCGQVGTWAIRVGCLRDYKQSIESGMVVAD